MICQILVAEITRVAQNQNHLDDKEAFPRMFPSSHCLSHFCERKVHRVIACITVVCDLHLNLSHQKTDSLSLTVLVIIVYIVAMAVLQ